MDGTPVNDLDSQMILARRYLAQNLPATCNVSIFDDVDWWNEFNKFYRILIW